VNTPLFSAIAEQISTVTEQSVTVRSVQALAGGDINTAFCLHSDNSRYFVKLNRADLIAMFAAECVGLQELAATKTLRVPLPITCGQTADKAFLVLEYLELGRASSHSERLLGKQLARLHQITQPYFGWHRDNTIGSTTQHNQQNDNWLVFWREQRLGFQLQLAAKNGYSGRLQTTGERLSADMTALFTGYTPLPSLLHGDLWAGNAAVDEHGNPVIFDPACYYGDREADLAMTELFGGFSREFYAAYRDTYPLHDGYAVRKKFYNLYHILNHLNLFGSGYLHQAERMIAMLLAEIV
jgi:fructosamine-3-kinase